MCPCTMKVLAKEQRAFFHVVSELIVYGAGKPEGFPALEFWTKRVFFSINNKISFDIRELLCILGARRRPRATW